MPFEKIKEKLKTQADCVHDLRFGLRDLKSSKAKFRQKQMQKVLDRAKKLELSTHELQQELSELINACNKELENIATQSPKGFLYSTPISDFEVSVRTKNLLKNNNVVTLGDLAGLEDISEVFVMKGAGRKVLNEVEDILEITGLK